MAQLATKEKTTQNKMSKFRFEIVNGDLFTCSAQASMLHCVSRDLKMGKGIAVLFRKKYGRISEMQKQNVQIGQAAILKVGSCKYVYNMVTKVAVCLFFFFSFFFFFFFLFQI